MRASFWAVAMMIAQPAYAWDKLEVQDVCAFAQTFDGPGSTMVVVSQSKDDFSKDQIIFSVSNDNWSIKEGDAIKEQMGILTEDNGFTGSAIAADHGFILLPNFELLDSFANSHPFSVMVKKDGAIIDRLNFSEFWAAFLTFRSCRRPWVEEKAERERLDNIEKNLPKDPFAKK